MGFVTSISGGAGVFAVPTLLAFGLPPVNVLALNRMSDLGVVTGALYKFHEAKSVDWSLALYSMPFMGAGALLGAFFVVSVPEAVLSYIIFVGILIGIFFLLKEPIQISPSHKVHASLMGYSFLFVVGIWNGALAMAGATFAVLVMVYFFRISFLRARATEIVAAVPETVISVVILALSSSLSFLPLLAMYTSSFVGATIGAHIAIKKGDVFIRKAMVAIAIIMIGKVFLDIFF